MSRYPIEFYYFPDLRYFSLSDPLSRVTVHDKKITSVDDLNPSKSSEGVTEEYGTVSSLGSIGVR